MITSLPTTSGSTRTQVCYPASTCYSTALYSSIGIPKCSTLELYCIFQRKSNGYSIHIFMGRVSICIDLVDPISCRKTIKRLNVPRAIWLDSATQGCNHHDIDAWFGGEACNLIGDLVSIEQAQEQRVRVGVLHKDNQAGAVRVINRVCVRGDTID